MGRLCDGVIFHKRRGAALGVILMVVAMAIVLAFSLSGTSFNHLGVSQRVDSQAAAREVAESAVSRTIYALMGDESFGTARVDADTVDVSPADGIHPQSAEVTFSPVLAGARGLGWSTNNLNGASSVSGYADRVVPESAAHVVATGTCGGSRVQVEALVVLPPFPYAIAAGGQFTGGPGMLVAGVDTAAKAVGPDGKVDRSNLLPATLASNSGDASAVVLSGANDVFGDLQAVGGIQVSDRTAVTGEVRSNASAVAIPDIDPTSFDPTGKPSLQTIDASALDNPRLNGYVRHQGDLAVNGDLRLDGAVLFVNGSLGVSGGIQGRGAIFTAGSVAIASGSQFSTDDVAAVVAGGDIAISGGSSGSFFQGLMYSRRGNVTARNTTILGAMITQTAGKAVTLNNSELIRPRNAGVVSFSLTPQTVDKTLTLSFNDQAAYDAAGTHTAQIRAIRTATKWEITLLNPADPPVYTDTAAAAARISQLLALAGWAGAGRSAHGTGGVGLPSGGPVPLQGGGPANNGAAYVIPPATIQNAIESLVPAPRDSLSGGRMSGTERFTLRLDQFLHPADRMRLLLWRVLDPDHS